MDHLPPGHIRLLHIEAGFDNEPVRCRLETTSLEASPLYEALSYTWGSLELNSAITCNGASMLVTHRLHEALYYLREREHERTVWIDAVCINQEDLRERGEQVRIMKEIFAKAFHVVIWLGRETEEDQVAFSVLDRFKNLFDTRGYGDVGPECYVDAGLPDTNDPDWAALVKLFQRPSFRRIWVVQEATVSRCKFSVPRSLGQTFDSLSIKLSLLWRNIELTRR